MKNIVLLMLVYRFSKTCPFVDSTYKYMYQCLSQDLETGCLKLAVVKLLGVQIFKGDHNILIFQPQTCINSSK